MGSQDLGSKKVVQAFSSFYAKYKYVSNIGKKETWKENHQDLN
jgi:hypothetical protein